MSKIWVTSDLHFCHAQPFVKTALERDHKHEGRAKVPRGVIRRMYFEMEMPIVGEGFTKITFIREEEDKIK